MAEPDRPIFIVGSPRSGSSALAHGLRDGAGIEGAHEGHVAPLLGELLRQTSSYYATRGAVRANPLHLLAQIPQHTVEQHLFGVFRQIYADLHATPVWYDKTVDDASIRICPTLLEVWPEARFLFVRRHGISNVCSRMRKFPEHSFEFHCADWARTMWSCMRVQPLLGDRALTVEQRTLAVHPHGAAREIGRFLGLTRRQERDMGDALATRHPEQTGPHPPSQFTPIEETGWNDAAVAVFRRECGPAMAALGYGESEWLIGPDASQIPRPFTDRHHALVGDGHRGDIEFGNGRLAGWVQSVPEPNQRERVELLVDGAVVAQVVADGFRQDLLDAGIGDGSHAFTWPVPEAMLDGKTHTVAVRIAGGGGSIATRPSVLFAS